MIKRKLTNIYLSSFELLTEALYLCWTNSFCVENRQLSKEKIKEHIKSYGIYDHKYAVKKDVPINFVNKLQFRTLLWVNKFVNTIDDNVVCNYVELYKQVINEIENNLFVLKDKTAQIAYANILLRNLDTSHIHKSKIDSAERDMRYMEIFEIVLDRKLIADNEIFINTDKCQESFPNFDLSARLVNHFDFIDKLIELFTCFDIDLITLADKHKHNLYIFDKNKEDSNGKSEFGTSSINTSDNQYDILPKFESPLYDNCLVQVMQYLIQKKKLENTNSDSWLFWFNRKYIKIPAPLKWKGSNTLLSNIIQHVCGESNSTTIKTAFCKQIYVKPTRKIYESGKMYKEIEQIITISKKKNS